MENRITHENHTTLKGQEMTVTLTRKNDVVFTADLRELVLFAFLRGFNPDGFTLLQEMTGDFQRECMVIAKVNLAGDDFVFELPQPIENKPSHS